MRDTEVPNRLTPAELERHAYAIAVSGYTIIPSQLSMTDLKELSAVSDRALAAVRKAIAEGIEVPFQPGSKHYEAANVLYCWGEVALALLEHPTVLQLADLSIKEYRLNDLTVFSALPAPQDDASVATTSWHRDCDDFDTESGSLWFFFYLDDLTTQNGATWIVPGSHRIRSSFEPPLERPWTPVDLDRFPSRKQLTGKAGDLVVIDARAIHTSGRNNSDRARRLINLGLVPERSKHRIRRNHWMIAGPRIQARAGERLRQLLGADWTDRDAGWPRSIVPEAWHSPISS